MARPLLEPEANHTAAFHAGGSPATSTLILISIAAAAAVAAVVVSLCTSGKNAGHRNKHRRSSSLAPAPQEQDDNNNNTGKRNNKAQLLASLSGIGVKAAAVAKMVSWKRSPAAGGWSGGDGEEGEGAAGVDEEDEALWKKTIMLGDKCRPLEFSGHIAFDSDGNPVQPPSPAAVKEDVAPGAANQA
ncbi:hypothetical protein HU200_020942 [Digitaria exilis]|uniref:Uncharacterized protein n=1 Tax=Digitaria exilis TaxID=1010633 RepID=A0A835KAF9_9POAL|nr:hypothetical protein HU200_020942 [Digitaria exilis]